MSLCDRILDLLTSDMRQTMRLIEQIGLGADSLEIIYAATSQLMEFQTEYETY